MRHLAALVLLTLGSLGATLPPDRYEVSQESRFWIDGTATTGPWTCEAEDVSGHGVLGGDALRAEVSVPVRAFHCGSGPMNRDLRHALHAETHPAISFTLDHAETLGSEPRPGAWVRVRATGRLRLAGAERTLTLDAEGRRLSNGRVALRGQHALRMTDFGVEPPSHALGLVRARDAIVVRFDLAAALTD